MKQGEVTQFAQGNEGSRYIEIGPSTYVWYEPETGQVHFDATPEEAAKHGIYFAAGSYSGAGIVPSKPGYPEPPPGRLRTLLARLAYWYWRLWN